MRRALMSWSFEGDKNKNRFILTFRRLNEEDTHNGCCLVSFSLAYLVVCWPSARNELDWQIYKIVQRECVLFVRNEMKTSSHQLKLTRRCWYFHFYVNSKYQGEE